MYVHVVVASFFLGCTLSLMSYCIDVTIVVMMVIGLMRLHLSALEPCGGEVSTDEKNPEEVTTV